MCLLYWNPRLEKSQKSCTSNILSFKYIFLNGYLLALMDYNTGRTYL